MAGVIESLLKGQCIKFLCSHLPWALAKGEGQSRLETLEERLGMVTLERELGEQSPGSMC